MWASIRVSAWTPGTSRTSSQHAGSPRSRSGGKVIAWRNKHGEIVLSRSGSCSVFLPWLAVKRSGFPRHHQIREAHSTPTCRLGGDLGTEEIARRAGDVKVSAAGRGALGDRALLAASAVSSAPEAWEATEARKCATPNPRCPAQATRFVTTTCPADAEPGRLGEGVSRFRCSARATSIPSVVATARPTGTIASARWPAPSWIIRARATGLSPVATTVPIAASPTPTVCGGWRPSRDGLAGSSESPSVASRHLL